ncbi:ABC transporter ATP-binding protein [Pantoea sp. Bo_2]|uniref:ABC transporter ATP-binding protein n=1 Tax=unclassified Pantoea TaxID=2630326 RepID=UPI00123202E8|nr:MULTISPECIES: ABC transporter ATP-binding protein [unclassified Pantoea]KAA5943850.1 ABC transporter ATP-binding protein [Pantoea sp. VH_3]KAA5951336.1 ABC transporter ATP-binding protein [Pantoea sp. VH_25]KAA5981267.1 ABC transporter ATP-binding protein [Pantoea sp. M_3]KAA6044023.1 ABC transporter ATP-binding protein [Pantoea sp. FN_2b]KAA6048878.1 ABC transporter ATP-binding protein [Pantoea sp. Bo_5]
MLSKDNALEIIDVSKCYQVFDSPIRRLKQFIVPNIERRLGKVPRVYHEEFWALQDISFNLPKGETLGVVGRNGSGKSTLLQIIAGTLSPTHGSVNIQGRVAALLELGAGFNGDFTGQENVYLNGALLGLTKEEIDNKLDDILSFADIGHFINTPVKTYSSGMMVRLAFAVQAQIDPEILIVDEALAVGDAKFQAKCFARLKQLKNDGTSILFVSHATEQIITHCDKAILLNDGSVVDNGAPKDIVNKYLDLLFGKSSLENTKRKKEDDHLKAASEIEKDQGERFNESLLKEPVVLLEENGFESRNNYNPNEFRWGDRAAEIMDFSLVQGENVYPFSVSGKDELKLQFLIKFNSTIFRPIFGFAVKTKDGVTIYNTNSNILDTPFIEVGEENKIHTVNVRLPMRLFQGDYFISIGLASYNTSGEVVPHDRRYDSIHITVEPTPEFLGLVNLEASINCE